MSFNILNSLVSSVPRLVRSLHNRAALRPIPKQRGTPADFLKSIGRSSETKLDIDTWARLWMTSGRHMKRVGLSIKDRRYILWCMERYRQGFDVKTFAHEARPRKKVRGWGPKAM